MNGIQIYQNNSVAFQVSITTNLSIVLSGFTPVMAISFLTGTTEITGTTIVNGITTFTVPNEVNDQTPYVYTYEIFIQNQTDNYTIIQDSYCILPSLLN
jgi:hypothetical protein